MMMIFFIATIHEYNSSLMLENIWLTPLGFAGIWYMWKWYTNITIYHVAWSILNNMHMATGAEAVRLMGSIFIPLLEFIIRGRGRDWCGVSNKQKQNITSIITVRIWTKPNAVLSWPQSMCYKEAREPSKLTFKSMILFPNKQPLYLSVHFS